MNCHLKCSVQDFMQLRDAIIHLLIKDFTTQNAGLTGSLEDSNVENTLGSKIEAFKKRKALSGIGNSSWPEIYLVSRKH